MIFSFSESIFSFLLPFAQIREAGYFLRRARRAAPTTVFIHPVRTVDFIITDLFSVYTLYGRTLEGNTGVCTRS